MAGEEAGGCPWARGKSWQCWPAKLNSGHERGMEAAGCPLALQYSTHGIWEGERMMGTHMGQNMTHVTLRACWVSSHGEGASGNRAAVES